MDQTNRRLFLGALAAGGSLAAGGALAAESGPLQTGPARDGHAAGADVAPDSTFLRTIPRKPGPAPVFTASLDGGPVKATWAAGRGRSPPTSCPSPPGSRGPTSS
ncbi:hypothetical protein ASF27_08350 [Methylobacterium sp. Leaf102]|uniref:hypothetical protein n=1 Tax=Methylobacterium sp. Leaf102 TaxID=1736253 RepID=UPI0006FE817C|nr:hypothetical protein [Methylobacterium sp. Leaf102]KQP28572.1 hypothetical protein ASF27_08350 [Methylobacterium sp. Leaf102]